MNDEYRVLFNSDLDILTDFHLIFKSRQESLAYILLTQTFSLPMDLLRLIKDFAVREITDWEIGDLVESKYEPSGVAHMILRIDGNHMSLCRLGTGFKTEMEMSNVQPLRFVPFEVDEQSFFETYQRGQVSSSAPFPENQLYYNDAFPNCEAIPKDSILREAFYDLLPYALQHALAYYEALRMCDQLLYASFSLHDIKNKKHVATWADDWSYRVWKNSHLFRESCKKSLHLSQYKKVRRTVYSVLVRSKRIKNEILQRVSPCS